MIAVSLIWFIPTIPALWVAFRVVTFIGEDPGADGDVLIPMVAFGIQATFFGFLSLVAAGPALAGLHSAVAPLARGDLFEMSRFWLGVRTHFRRAWILATIDVSIGVVLVLNIWFYWTSEVPGIWLLAILFAYGLFAWACIQPYLFPLLIELDQKVTLVLRNAVFVAMDNLGLTLGMFAINAVLISIAAPLGAILVPFALPAILANMHLRAVVTVIERYRETGRILPRDGESVGEGYRPTVAHDEAPVRHERDEDDARGLGGRPRRLNG
jgi:uncharacterized membrane protein YesL